MVPRPENANDEEETVDRFTCLPDNIIYTILSFLPMKHACRTCFSSKKLIHLLASLPNLHFGHAKYYVGWDDTTRSPVEFVEKFLEKRDASINSFSLHVDFNVGNFDVEHWISLLLQNGVEDLELDILGKYVWSETCGVFVAEKCELPAKVFTSETIRSLKLWRCYLKPPPCCTAWGFLETVFLGKMNLTDDVISCLVTRCVVLRTLTLHRCKEFEKIEIVQPNSRLECLKLEYCPTAITVNAPNLRALYYYCRTTNLCLEGPSNVANVFYKKDKWTGGLEVPRRHRGEGENLKKNVLHNLANVQSLSLTGLLIKSLARERVSNTMGVIYLGLRKLTLQINLVDPQELKLLSSWLRSCPNLNELNIEIADETSDEYIHRSSYKKSLAYFKSVHRNPREYECLNTLELIRINGFGLECYSGCTELIKFFLANTPELKKMDLVGMEMMPPSVENVKNMPRASEDAIINVT